MSKKQLIFDSRAMKFWFPDFKRELNDLDIITKEELMTEKEH